MFRILFIVLFSIGHINMGQAQPCKNYHKKNCGAIGGSWKVNSQSKSGLFSKGMTSELNFVVYKGQEYRLTICAESFLGNRIEFKIKDPKTGITLYDNMVNNYSPVFEFSCASTRRLTIVIKVPEGDPDGKEERKKDKGACLGVLIENMTTPDKDL